MSSMCVEITTSMPIAEQILRHRSFSFQKFSGRYSEMDKFEPIEIRKQATKNRQSSTEVFNPVIYTVEDDPDWKFTAQQLIDDFLYDARDVYKELIKAGVAKECARMVLPLATQTTMYMAGTIRSWIHYIAIRTDEHTQKEHRLVAEAIKAIFVAQYPTVAEALGWHQTKQEDSGEAQAPIIHKITLHTDLPLISSVGDKTEGLTD